MKEDIIEGATNAPETNSAPEMETVPTPESEAAPAPESNGTPSPAPTPTPAPVPTPNPSHPIAPNSPWRSFWWELLRPRRPSIFPLLALLVARHLIPEIQEDIPLIYELYDEVVIPVWEWGAGALLNGLEWFCSLPWMEKLLELLSRIAA